MSIDYVEVRGGDLQLRGIIDTAMSVIWHSVFFGVGDFEIYAQATHENVALLGIGNYVTRPDDLEVGIIEKIEIADDPQNGKMITASGRFAKSLLDRRLIYNLSGTVNTPTILRGKVETEVRRVIEENAIDCPFDRNRNIPVLALGDMVGFPHKIVDSGGVAAQKQVSYENLLSYTDAVLEEYGLAAMVVLDEDAGKLRYVVYSGEDRSADSWGSNDPIIFSKDFDNLTSTTYQYDATTERNVALIGGAGEGLERFFSLVGSSQGLQRREMWVDASSVNRSYKDENEEEQTYTDDEYLAMLDATGLQNVNASRATEVFDGTLDLQNSGLQYNKDYSLGDIVTVQDDNTGNYFNVQLCEIIEVQDENGYSIECNSKTVKVEYNE